MKQEIQIIKNQATELLSQKDAIIEQIKNNNVARSFIDTNSLICTISIIQKPKDKNTEVRLFEELDKIGEVIQK